MTDRPIDRESPSAERCAQTPRHELIEGAARFLSGHARHRLEFDAPNGLSGVFAWCRDCSHSIHYPFVPAVDPQSREVIPEINWSPEMASHDDYAPAPVSEPKGEGLAALMVPETIHSIVESTKHISIGVPRVVQLERAIDRIAALSRRSTVTPEPTCASGCGCTPRYSLHDGPCSLPPSEPTDERTEARERTPFVVDTCCSGRDVWHVDESKHRHAGPMKKIGNQRHSTGPNTYMNFYECAACHERAWVGLDAESRIVTRREGEL
jgi:hypothetical protein